MLYVVCMSNIAGYFLECYTDTDLVFMNNITMEEFDKLILLFKDEVSSSFEWIIDDKEKQAEFLLSFA